MGKQKQYLYDYWSDKKTMAARQGASCYVSPAWPVQGRRALNDDQ